VILAMTIEQEEKTVYGVERCLGTCLVLSHLVMSGKMDFEDFILQAQLCSQLSWSALPGNATFSMILSRFLALTDPAGPLHMQTGWLNACDAFRVALLQRPDGSFGATAGLAEALRATLDVHDENASENGVSKSNGTEAVDSKEAPLTGKQQRQRLAELWRVNFMRDEEIDTLYEGLHGENVDDPDHTHIIDGQRNIFTPAALLATKPKELSDEQWSSLLAKEWLVQRNERSFVVNPWRKANSSSNLDLLRLYLGEKHISTTQSLDPETESTLRSDEENMARDLVKHWFKHYDAQVRKAQAYAKLIKSKRLKEARSKNPLTAMNDPCSRLNNAIQNLMHVFLSTHIVFRVFYVRVTDRFSRGKRLFCVCSTIFVALTVSIWIWYQRAEQCCEQMRIRLGCPATINTECMGETRCPAIQILPEAVVLPSCTAFPKKNSILDTIFVILLTVVIVVPTRLAIQIPFEKGESIADPGHYHYAPAKLSFVGFFVHVVEILAVSLVDPKMAGKRAKELLSRIIPALRRRLAMLTSICIRPSTRRAMSKTTSVKVVNDKIDGAKMHMSMINRPGSEEYRRADADALNTLGQTIGAKRTMARAGVALMVSLWAVCTWIVFAYGVMMYEMDPSLEDQYFRTWAVSLISDLFGRDALAMMLKRSFLLVLFSWLASIADSLTVQRFHEETISNIATHEDGVGDVDNRLTDNSVSADGGGDDF